MLQPMNTQSKSNIRNTVEIIWFTDTKIPSTWTTSTDTARSMKNTDPMNIRTHMITTIMDNTEIRVKNSGQLKSNLGIMLLKRKITQFNGTQTS